MTMEEKRLLGEMVKAIEKKNEKELEYLIAKRDAEAAEAAYRKYASQKEGQPQ